MTGFQILAAVCVLGALGFIADVVLVRFLCRCWGHRWTEDQEFGGWRCRRCERAAGGDW